MSVIYRAPTQTYAAGAVLPIPTNFLDPARKMSAPVIERIVLRVNYTMSTGVAKTPKQRISELFTKILLSDAAGDRINLRGSSLYFQNQVENGVGYADGAHLAASGAGQTGQFFLELPFTPAKARRRNDYGLSLLEFLDGGQLILNLTSSAGLGSATEITSIGATTIDIFAQVREERRREAKSRIVFLDYDQTVTEYTYPVNGSLRSAFMYAGEVAQHAGTTYAAQNITSRTIDYSQIPDDLLRKVYQLESWPRVADGLGLVNATNISEDAVVALFGIPIVWPRKEQKIGEMFDMTGLHVKTDGTVTTSNLPKLIVSVITDRQPQLTARTFGARTLQDLGNAVAKYGKVKTANYGTADDSLSNWAPQIVRRLPFVLSK